MYSMNPADVGRVFYAGCYTFKEQMDAAVNAALGFKGLQKVWKK